MLNSVRNVLSGLCSWRARWKTRNVRGSSVSSDYERGKKKIFVASLNLNSIAVTFRNWEEEQEFQNYRAHYPLTERHPERFRSPRTESRERTKVEFEQRERTKLSTTRETL